MTQILNRLRLLPFAAILALMVGACASTGNTATGDEVTVRVENNMSAASSITVYAVPESGVRQVLGSVSAGETKDLTFNPTGLRYRLVADPLTGGDVVSQPISLTEGETLRWVLNTNTIISVSEGR